MIWIVVAGCAASQPNVTVIEAPAPVIATDSWGHAAERVEPPCSPDDVMEGPVNGGVRANGYSFRCRLGPAPGGELHELVRTDAALRTCLEAASSAGSAELALEISAAGHVVGARLVDQLGTPPIACAPLVLRLRVVPAGCRWHTTVTLAVARTI